MSFDNHPRARLSSAFACIATAVLATTAQGQSPPQSPSPAADSQVQAAMSRLLTSILSDTSVHMRMVPTRAATSADSARAATFVRVARTALGRYADVTIAERDGYYRNAPQIESQPIYHYNNSLNIAAAARGDFDPAKPVSLLYKNDDQGRLRLIGAMYATGTADTPDALDALLPTSMARWHQHVNFCNPGGVARRASNNAAATVLVIQAFNNITSEKDCWAAGGRFVPVEFGWMTHVYLFAGDDPRVIWEADDMGNMDMKTTPGSAGGRRP